MNQNATNGEALDKIKREMAAPERWKSHKELSRQEYGQTLRDGETPSPFYEVLRLGCLMRIAEGVERICSLIDPKEIAARREIEEWSRKREELTKRLLTGMPLRRSRKLKNRAEKLAWRIAKFCITEQVENFDRKSFDWQLIKPNKEVRSWLEALREAWEEIDAVQE